MARCFYYLAMCLLTEGLRPTDFFVNLHVSNPLQVTVNVNPSLSQPEVYIGADDQSLGWIVTSSVLPTAFGPTLFLGINERAWGLGQTWAATISVPSPLHALAATGGASISADTVLGDVIVDSGSSISVSTVNSTDVLRSLVFRASSHGSISVSEGRLARLLIQASEKGNVNLGNASVSFADIEAEGNSTVFADVSMSARILCSEATIEVQGRANIFHAMRGLCNITVARRLEDRSAPSIIIP